MTNIRTDQLNRVADTIGTPCYVYDAAALRNRIRQLRDAINNARFFYSLKANPNKSIVRVISQQGVGAEVCSYQELKIALAAGVAPKNIIFVGPAKTTRDVAAAVDHKIKAIIVESIEELGKINEIARTRKVVQDVALRINPEFHTLGARLSMSGVSSQFGIDPSELDRAFDVALSSNHLRLAGIHVYMGTRILDHDVVLENTKNILALAEDLMLKRGVSFDFVDIGGGFGITYSPTETPLDLAALGHSLTKRIHAFKQAYPDTEIVIELGRYIVAEAGVFLTRVEYVKNSKNSRFAICDGGSNVHAAAAQGASFRRNFPLRPLNPRTGSPQEWNISGPLCTPTDLIGKNVMTPPLKPGDLVRIDKSGAYGLSFSPVNFLSFEAPAEVLFDGDDMHLIRQRATLEEYLLSQEAQLLPKQTKHKREHQSAEL